MTTLNSKPRILIIGDAVVPTGFARAIRSIFEPLQNNYELHQMATRYDGGPRDYPWKIYPAKLGGDVYGYSQQQGIERPHAIVKLSYNCAVRSEFLQFQIKL